MNEDIKWYLEELRRVLIAGKKNAASVQPNSYMEGYMDGSLVVINAVLGKLDETTTG